MQLAFLLHFSFPCLRSLHYLHSFFQHFYQMLKAMSNPILKEGSTENFLSYMYRMRLHMKRFKYFATYCVRKRGMHVLFMNNSRARDIISSQWKTFASCLFSSTLCSAIVVPLMYKWNLCKHCMKFGAKCIRIIKWNKWLFLLLVELG